MTRKQEEIKSFIVKNVYEKWNEVLFDSACPYSDGSLGLTFCVCVDYGVNIIVSVIIERKDDYYDALERLNERIAWTFASEHLRDV